MDLAIATIAIGKNGYDRCVFCFQITAVEFDFLYSYERRVAEEFYVLGFLAFQKICPRILGI